MTLFAPDHIIGFVIVSILWLAIGYEIRRRELKAAHIRRGALASDCQCRVCTLIRTGHDIGAPGAPVAF